MTSPTAHAVAVCQFGPVADRAVNLASMRALALRAVEQGAGLIVFPEYSSYFTPKLGPDWLAAAENLDGPFVAGLADLAGETGSIIVAGLIETGTRDDRFRNTIVAVGPDGTLLSVSRKLHLYDAFGATESDWAEPGGIEPPRVFEALGLRVGIQTCYDLRFPEVTRRLVDAGAELVLVPSEWVAGPGKVHAWTTLVTARAIENTVYVAAADHIPPVGVGHSMIVDARGELLASIETATDAAVAPVSRAHLDEVRRLNPALQLRRFRVEPA
ncbi:MAG: carbon-nitrogen hydrolase family protein [Microcella sp.]|uniref:carbon-nitrogen hydrolase family protein n=1 Tax=Microcella sp. TaxID=1913979 RepID=UPI0024CCF126|nr:carbon-nitrogen hydrolase family protein [Microcella sp.]UYN84810.1 MAG: carbon-nitrogen hydrolase family protein [Microcella sp.]